MNILITGASGLVGKVLLSYLVTGGHNVKPLSRSAHWDPLAGKIDPAVFEGIDAVVHLAGEPIAQGRWTKSKRHRILNSRVKGTQLISASMANLDVKPKILISASAIGYYGDRADEKLNEDSRAGKNFLAQVCDQWEQATYAASANGVRVVNLRMGVVLSADGGALAKMLLPFKLGMGGRLASGEQYMSWISINDLLGVIHHVLMTQTLAGPVNAVSPDPVTNIAFTKTLGNVLSRPTIFPMPARVARIIFGQMADELLIASARVLPDKLVSSGYQFHHPKLETALRQVLGR
jgi:hypothetical protein